MIERFYSLCFNHWASSLLLFLCHLLNLLEEKYKTRLNAKGLTDTEYNRKITIILDISQLTPFEMSTYNTCFYNKTTVDSYLANSPPWPLGLTGSKHAIPLQSFFHHYVFPPGWSVVFTLCSTQNKRLISENCFRCLWIRTSKREILL